MARSLGVPICEVDNSKVIVRFIGVPLSLVAGEGGEELYDSLRSRGDGRGKRRGGWLSLADPLDIDPKGFKRIRCIGAVGPVGGSRDVDQGTLGRELPFRVPRCGP